MSREQFRLHERLAADTVSLGSSALCEVRLMNDSTWPWVLLVPAVPGIREIHELSVDDQQQLIAESSLVSRALLEFFNGDKMNVAALGNMVPQLHLHHIVRFEGDPAWPGPVWGKQPPKPYRDDTLAKVVADFRKLLRPILRDGS